MLVQAFKRLVIGTRFTWNQCGYRKIGPRHAFQLKPNGVGITSTRVAFARSVMVFPTTTKAGAS